MNMGDRTTTVLAGRGISGFADGQGTLAVFNGPYGLVIHPITGVIYIAEFGNHRIRACTKLGNVSTLAGSATSGNDDGDAYTATFRYPEGIVMDSTSVNLYVTCNWIGYLRKVLVLSGYTTTLASLSNPQYDR